MWVRSCGACLISLRIITSSSIHVVANGKTCPWVVAEAYSIVYVYMSLLSVLGWLTLGLFLCLGYRQECCDKWGSFFDKLVLLSLDTYILVRLLDPMVILPWVFWGTSIVFAMKVYYWSTFQQHCVRGPFAPHLHQHVIFAVFLASLEWGDSSLWMHLHFPDL